MRNRFFAWILSLVLGTVFSSLVWAQAIRLGTPYKPNALYNMPFFAAEDQDLWKKRGLEVKFTPFATGRHLDDALAGGHLDGGISTTHSVIIGIAKGLDKFIVADLQGYDRWFVWVLEPSPLRQPQGLKGKTLAVAARPGSVGYAYNIMLLKVLGLEGQVKMSSVGGTDIAIASLQSGVADAFISTVLSVGAAKFQGKVRELLDLSQFFPKEVWSDAVVFATGALTRGRPEIVKKMVATLLEAARFINANPSWAIRKLQSEYAYTEEESRLIYAELRYASTDGRISRKMVENARDFLTDYQLIPKEKTPPAEKLFTDIFTQ